MITTVLVALVALACSSIAVDAALLGLLYRGRSLARSGVKSEVNGKPGTQICPLLVVPCLLTSKAEIRRLVEKLKFAALELGELCRGYCLLLDYPDGNEQQEHSLTELLHLARTEIDSLNDYLFRNGARRLLLLHRERRWCVTQRQWIGWERKRGKLHELNALLLGKQSQLQLYAGDQQLLGGTSHVLTLDADSSITKRSLHVLLEAASRPMATPRLDSRKMVISGHAVLQPQVVSRLDASSTLMQWIMHNDAFHYLYGVGIPNAYQILFEEGTYFGKGIYVVDAFHTATCDRFPDDSILSHDIIEGCFARSGAVSHAYVTESEAPTHLEEAKRRHRWIRGDWQSAPWIPRKVPARDCLSNDTPLSLLSRWKLLDNVRRSTVSVAQAALLCYFTFRNATTACAFVLLVMSYPHWSAAISATVCRFRKGKATLYSTLQSSLRYGLRVVLAVAFCIFDAVVAVDAIARTVWRMQITRRNLLEWTAFVASPSGSKKGGAPGWYLFGLIVNSSIGLLGYFASADLSIIPSACLVLWSASPVIASLLMIRIRNSTCCADETEE